MKEATGDVTRGLDPFLQFLVTLSNSHNISFPVTLTVGGQLVTGDLVSRSRYFDGLADLVTEGLEEKANMMSTFIDMFRESAVPPDETPALSGDPQPEFIHLANAFVYTSDQRALPTDRSLLWRGRLSMIGGFSLGKLEYRVRVGEPPSTTS